MDEGAHDWLKPRIREGEGGRGSAFWLSDAGGLQSLDEGRKL